MGQASEGPRHYHVTTGMGGGYSPNTVASYRTKKEAQAAAREEAKRWRDEEFEGPRKVSGNAESGYVLMDPDSETDLGEYIEVSEVCYCEEVWWCTECKTLNDEHWCWCCGAKASESRGAPYR